MADYTNPYLLQLIKGQQDAYNAAAAQQAGGGGLSDLLAVARLKETQAQNQRTDLDRDAARAERHEARKEREELKAETKVEKQASELSKRYEKMIGFNTALQELEGLTNVDKKGGVLTNPNAKLMSAGKVMSAVPASALGIGELVGAVPKGTVETKKATERLLLEYQKAMSGLRVTEERAKQEKVAMGQAVSGDPELQSKGIRALARVMRESYKTIQGGGYSPEALEQAHKHTGDPRAMYDRIYEDTPPMPPQEAPAALPPAGIAPAPMAPAATPGIPTFEEWKKQKAAGGLRAK